MSRFISYLNSCNCRVTSKEKQKEEIKSAPFFCKLTLNDGSVVKLKGSGELTRSILAEYNNTIVSAEIGELCTSIGDSAFYGRYNLKSVTISDSVTNIGDQAFKESYVESITINALTPPPLSSNTIDTMPCGIYVPCESLSLYIESWNDVRIKSTDCPLPYNMIRYTGSKLSETTSNKSGGLHTNAFNTAIKKHLWNYGTGLIIFNDDVTSIGDYAFYNCTNLASIDIPDSVTRIGQGAFGYCTGLKSFTLPKNLKSTGPEPFIYTNITSVTINCNGFQNGGTSLDPVELIIGSEVESFNYGVISNTNLTKITSLATTAPTISSNTFSGIKTNGTLYVPVDSSGYDVWMGTGNYCLGKYGWTMVEQ